MNRNYFSLFVLLSFFIFSNCSDDDNDKSGIPQNIADSLIVSTATGGNPVGSYYANFPFEKLYVKIDTNASLWPSILIDESTIPIGGKIFIKGNSNNGTYESDSLSSSLSTFSHGVIFNNDTNYIHIPYSTVAISQSGNWSKINNSIIFETTSSIRDTFLYTANELGLFLIKSDTVAGGIMSKIIVFKK